MFATSPPTTRRTGIASRLLRHGVTLVAVAGLLTSAASAQAAGHTAARASSPKAHFTRQSPRIYLTRRSPRIFLTRQSPKASRPGKATRHHHAPRIRIPVAREAWTCVGGPCGATGATTVTGTRISTGVWLGGRLYAPTYRIYDSYTTYMTAAAPGVYAATMYTEHVLWYLGASGWRRWTTVREYPNGVLRTIS
jgi:hypothetical protein